MTGAVTGAAIARFGLALLVSAVAHLLLVWVVGPAWDRAPPPAATGSLTARLASAEPAGPAVEVVEAASALPIAREGPAPPRERVPETARPSPLCR